MRDEFPRLARASFRALIARPEFSCLGAKAAFNDGAYRIGTYDELATDTGSARLAKDLRTFRRSTVLAQSEYATFIAVFRSPLGLTEQEFEEKLWQQLRLLHAIDRRESVWSTEAARDPADPHFSFSFAGQAFYVLGMHAASSRRARRFDWPAIVFNPHAQFERLRSEGKWKRMQRSIRAREIALQGSTNPMLSEFGERSEARQYSGRAVPDDWEPPFPKSDGKCPFAH